MQNQKSNKRQIDERQSWPAEDIDSNSAGFKNLETQGSHKRPKSSPNTPQTPHRTQRTDGKLMGAGQTQTAPSPLPYVLSCPDPDPA